MVHIQKCYSAHHKLTQVHTPCTWFYDTVYVVIRQLLLLRVEFRIPKLTFHSDLLHSTLEKIPLFTPQLCGMHIWPGPQIARSGRTAAAPARPMGAAAACVYNAHIESPSDTPSLPVSIAATVNFAQMQTKAANDC